jgi:hypothetical protein|tara:strand:+ start:3940 stop:4116 length:177 start_codon:yes stop_codon:yes gene_type:complete
MTHSEEIEEILINAHSENISNEVILEVNKLGIRDIKTIEARLKIYTKAIENVRRNKTV